MNHILPLFARLLIIPIFVYSAIHKIGDPEGTVETMRKVGIEFQTELFMYGAIAFLLIGSLLVLLGLKSRVGVFLLLLFLIPTTLLFHMDLADVSLYKNAGLIAALLMIMANGPGGVSLDAKMDKTQ